MGVMYKREGVVDSAPGVRKWEKRLFGSSAAKLRRRQRASDAASVFDGLLKQADLKMLKKHADMFLLRFRYLRSGQTERGR